jgi:hypothetical protein
MSENEREGDGVYIILPLIIACNRLIDDIAIESGIGTEYIIRELERTSIEAAGTPCCFLAGFRRNNPGITELDVPSAYTQNLDRAYYCRHIKNILYVQ